MIKTNRPMNKFVGAALHRVPRFFKRKESITFGPIALWCSVFMYGAI